MEAQAKNLGPMAFQKAIHIWQLLYIRPNVAAILAASKIEQKNTDGNQFAV
jgi:hypothetical protein